MYNQGQLKRRRGSGDCRNGSIHLQASYGWSEIGGGLRQNTALKSAKSDELEALSQPHPAYHEDEMGGNVGDEEDSDVLDVGDCLWGKTPVKRLSSLGSIDVILFLFTISTSRLCFGHNCHSKHYHYTTSL